MRSPNHEKTREQDQAIEQLANEHGNLQISAMRTTMGLSVFARTDEGTLYMINEHGELHQ